MNDNSNKCSIGLNTIVFLIFLVLKLTHVIDWSWWWVTAPIWGYVALCFVISFIVAIVKKIKRRK